MKNLIEYLLIGILLGILGINVLLIRINQQLPIINEVSVKTQCR